MNLLTGNDLRAILEQVESPESRYATSDGFLDLLNALLLHGIPEDLGMDLRRPGILIYLEYIIDEIILKV